MYNGVGLTTAKGSGANGYVEINKFVIGRVPAVSSKGFGADQGTVRKPNKDILEHNLKRRIKIKLVKLEDKLLDQGFTNAEVDERLEAARRTLEADATRKAGPEWRRSSLR